MGREISFFRLSLSLPLTDIFPHFQPFYDQYQHHHRHLNSETDDLQSKSLSQEVFQNGKAQSPYHRNHNDDDGDDDAVCVCAFA